MDKDEKVKFLTELKAKRPYDAVKVLTDVWNVNRSTIYNYFYRFKLEGQSDDEKLPIVREERSLTETGKGKQVKMETGFTISGYGKYNGKILAEKLRKVG